MDTLLFRVDGAVAYETVRNVVAMLPLDESGGWLCAPSPLGTRALPRMEYPKDLKAVTAHPIGDEIGLVGHRPFTRIFDSALTAHRGKPDQFVYAGENRI